jgi:hypothetical protein
MGEAMSDAQTSLPPFIGPRPFGISDRDRDLFFGRRREAHEISSLLLANKLILLYAESGAGKTSIFNAGVRPLIKDDFDILPTARLQSRTEQSESEPANVYTRAVLSWWADPGEVSQFTQVTLAEYLTSQPHPRAEDEDADIDLLVPRLLVFDQFEELFITHPDRWPQRREFLEQLAEASDLDPELRVLIIMREDFLARLLNFADPLFGGMKDRYFLEPLQRPSAELAISGPVTGAGKSFEYGAVENLVQRLMKTRVDVGEGRFVEIEGEFVEPILLQVVCQRLWALLPADVATITVDHINQFADVGSALGDFYSETVRQAAAAGGIAEREVRSWVGQNFITPGGTRSTVYVGAKSNAGLPDEAVSVLEGRVLRGEQRAGARWLEITHDSLLAPIEQSNAEFFRLRRYIDPMVAQLAAQLAQSVEHQWEQEYAVGTFNDPAQRLRDLTPSWSAAPASLGVPWDSVVQLALGPAGYPGTQSRNWAAGPEALAGLNENDLAWVLRRVPTGWLAVLGGAGSGKTMLLLRTILKLVNDRASGDPIPVLLPMSSWDPERDTLRSWLERQLAVDYPGLATVPGGGEKRPVASILLDEQLIAPLLDGLDEMAPASQMAAINRLNEAFADPKRPLLLVVSCRTEDYRNAVGRPEDGRRPLLAAAAIELHALDPDKLSSYLRQRGRDRRWAEVDAQLEQPGSVLAKALSTPFYASLTSVIYSSARNPAPWPVELCAFPDVASVRNHLLDAFIPAVYLKASEEEGAEHPERRAFPAERWLMILADYLTNGERHTTSLEWWNLRGLAPRWLVPCAAGTVCGIAAAVATATGPRIGTGIGIGFGTGVLIAILIGLGAFHGRRQWDGGRVARRRLSRQAYDRRYRKRYPGPGMAGGMVGAVLGGLAAGVAGSHHIGHDASLFSSLPEALGIAIAAGACTDFFGGLAGTLVGSFAAGYLASVGLGLPATLVNGLAVGLAAALTIEIVGRRGPSRKRPKWDLMVGIPGGAIVGVAIGLTVWREAGVALGIGLGAVLAVLAALPLGLRHVDEDLRFVPSPGVALARDAQAFRLTALSAGLAAGATGFLGASMTAVFEVHAKVSLANILADGLGIGSAAGLIVGLTFGFYHAASPEFRIITWWLALQRKTPWRLMRFLEQAHRLSVLRQSGAAYQFRHVSLQLRLAARYRATITPGDLPISPGPPSPVRRTP